MKNQAFEGSKTNRLRRVMQGAVPELLENRRMLSGTPIILDNTSAGVTVTGAWTYKSGVAGAYNGDYLHDIAAGKGSKSVQYTPTIPTAGQYQVFGWWQTNTIRANNVPYEIVSTAGTTTVLENQQINGAQWNLLGTYQFNAGTAGSVKIRNTGTAANSYVDADAVEFVPVVTTTGEAPYPGPNPVSVPGQIEAENYDTGGEGVAYHDLDTANQGGAYRTTDGVDIESTGDVGGGYNVGHIRAGEWMQYTVNVPTAGNYIFSTRVASASGGTFHFSDGSVSTGAITFPNTGDWQTWKTVASGPVALQAGQQIVRLSFDTAAVIGGDVGNVNWFQISSAAASTPVVSLTSPTYGQSFTSGSTISLAANASESGGTIKSVDFYQGTTKLGTDTTAPYSLPWSNVPAGNYNLSASATDTNGITASSSIVSIAVNASTTEAPFSGTPITVPGNIIPAVNYDTGGEGVAYHDVDAVNNGGANYRPGDGVDIQTSTDPGTSYNVDHISAGEYLKYTLNVTTSGSYDIATRLSVANAGGQFHYEVDGVNATGTIAARYTLGYTTWQTVSTGSFAMTAGKHVLKLVWDSSMDGNEIADLASINITPAFTSTPWPTAWTSGTAAPSVRFESVGHLLNGKIYEFGGFKNAQFQVSNEVDVYDVASNTWKVLNNIPAGVAQTHQGVTDDGTYIYFAGGYAGDLQANTSPSQVGSNAVWQFNPTSDTWRQMPSLPDIRGAAPMVYLNGKLHYFGGNPADRVTNLGTHYVFDLAAWKANPTSVTGWTLAAPMPNPRDHSSAVVLNGLIYSIGGEHGHDAFHQQQSDNWSYSDVTNSWTQLAAMPIAKSHTEGGTFVYNGRIIWATGQTDNFNSTTNVIEYDPARNSWQELPPMPVAREGATVAVYNNEVLEIDGGIATNAPSNTVYIGVIPAIPAVHK